MILSELSDINLSYFGIKDNFFNTDNLINLQFLYMLKIKEKLIFIVSYLKSYFLKFHKKIIIFLIFMMGKKQ